MLRKMMLEGLKKKTKNKNAPNKEAMTPKGNRGKVGLCLSSEVEKMKVGICEAGKND